MTQFQGFKTRKEANEFLLHHGGMLCYKKSGTERWAEHPHDYDACVYLGGLNPDLFPYVVTWQI